MTIRYLGKVCSKHPELNGERYTSCCKCLGCHREVQREQNRKRKAAKHPTQMRIDREKSARYYARNVEQERAKARKRGNAKYQALTPEQRREKQQNWYRQNREKAIWSARVRRDLVKRQMPTWADKASIGAIYREAKRRNLTVDHIVPLKGRRVSGLHVAANLRLLTRSENASKSNSFEEHHNHAVPKC